jgi:hypothetical protein
VNGYLIPQAVYVGDPAVLVIPLERPLSGEALSLPPVESLSLPDLAVHRVELESRGAGGRLVIHFTAYAPGPLELPPFEIGGLFFEGIRVEIASILGSGEDAAALSPPAPPLAIPGTSLLIYGTLAGAVLIFLTVLWAFLWAPRRLEGWLKKWRRKRLILSLALMERRLRKTLTRGAGAPQRAELLNFLTGEFRSFLSLLTGENCRAMTAGELSRLSLGEALTGAAALEGGFLGGFFRRCDDLRFSGADIGAEELLEILGDLKRFVEALSAPPPPEHPPGGLSPAADFGAGGSR